MCAGPVVERVVPQSFEGEEFLGGTVRTLTQSWAGSAVAPPSTERIDRSGETLEAPSHLRADHFVEIVGNPAMTCEEVSFSATASGSLDNCATTSFQAREEFFPLEKHSVSWLDSCLSWCWR